MPDQQLTDVIRYVRRIVGAEHKARTDRELLTTFTTHNDQAAFTTLVKRHGPMVMGICRRVLHHLQDAEDAFQATFLLLARHSADIRNQESLASWLHGVAYRMAHNAKRSTFRRRKYEEKVKPAPSVDQGAELEWREVQAILDDEIQRLPETYRTPFILFYLESRKQTDIAQQLKIKEGTVWSRLAHARRLLQERLSRRGVALPAVLGLLGVSAGASMAAVPNSLVSSVVQAAALSAAGGAVATVASAEVMALLQGAHQTMTLSKCKIATLILLAAGIVGTGFGFALHRSPTVQATETAREESPQAQPAPVSARPEEKKEIAVTGRVVDENGKPIAGAEVAVVVQEVLRFSSWERNALDKTELKARTTSDADGRFRLTTPQLPPVTRRGVRVLARAPGHALAWAPVDPDAREAKVELRLAPEGPIAGKVVDLAGGPVAGLKIHASRLTRKKGDGSDTLPLPADAVTATTDERGRFAFPSIGRGLSAHLEIDDLQCAPKELDVNAGDEKSGYLVLGVMPPQVIEGRVVCEDTGKPMPYARLDINSYTKSEEGYFTGGGAVLGQADAQGRFKISTYPGNTGFVIAMPPDGQPYLVNSTDFNWSKGMVKQEVEVKLSRGLLVHGKITEAGSGKPLANASVEYQTARDDVVKVKSKISGGWRGRVLTATDGSYTLAVPPGRCHLLVTAPTPDYIAEPVGSAGVEIAKPGGDPFYYHAVAVLDLKGDEKPKEMSFALRRGVTLKGTVMDPDGKPVKDAVLLVGGLRPAWEKALTPTEIHDGRWELRGCDPERTYHLLFLACPDKPQMLMTAEGIGSTGRLMLPMLLGPKNKLGAAVDIPAKKAGGGPVEVRLQPTGSARLRFHDAQGKILPSYNPSLELVVSPGPTFAKALQEGTLAGETAYLMAPIGQPGKKPPQADDAGAIIVEGLIPGATYRLRNFQQPEIFKEFTVESGKRAEVDVTVK